MSGDGAGMNFENRQTRIATGAHRGEPWRRLGDQVEPSEGESPEADPEASVRVPQHGGMSLDFPS
jgi:hypothetical protein